MSSLSEELKKAGISVSDKEESAITEDAKPGSYPVIKIKMLAGGRGAVWIGDFIVPLTTKISFHSEVNEISRVRIEMIALGGVEVEAESAVDLDFTVFDKYKPVILKRDGGDVEMRDTSTTAKEYSDFVLYPSGVKP